MSTAFMDGAEKYGPYNWRKTGVSMMVYLRALNSHYQLFLDGEDHDPKTKVHHLAYVMANCAIILDGMTKEGVMVDDRPPPGAAAELTERFVEQGHLMPSPSLARVTTRESRQDMAEKIKQLKSSLISLAIEVTTTLAECKLCGYKTELDEPPSPKQRYEHERECPLYEGD